MKLHSALLSALLITPSVFATDYLKGNLVKHKDGFAILSQGQLIPITTDDKTLASLPSLEAPSYVTQSNNKKYTFEFKGEYSKTGFLLEQVPTQVPGDIAITGVLEYDLANKTYLIEGVKARYGYTKVLNGYEFDDISKNSFVGKSVLAEGYMDEDGIFVMNAITPTNLFEATKANPAPTKVEAAISEYGAWDFIYNVMNKNEYSQSEDSFRVTFYEDENNKVQPGDDFLVITMSGRQGDSFGSVNGHFVAGLGDVKEDMTLRGEVSNAYVTNGKDILSGNVSLTNYFSHTVQGQNNYRPTYTFIAYGIDKEKLKKFRDALEPSHILFRTQNLDITPEFNCTTETIKALKAVGIKGNFKKYDNVLKGIFTSPLMLFGETTQTLHYSLRNDASKFQPRPAYNSFAGVFLRSDLRKKLGIKRVDFVYYAQTPSDRPVGGMALGGLFPALKYKKLYEKYEVNEATKLSPEELRPILEEKLQEIE